MTELQNVEMTVDAETLIIKIDLSKTFGESSSKKSLIIASTSGAVAVPQAKYDEIKVNLNVYKANKKKK